MPNVKKDVSRVNVNVNPEIKKRLDNYAKENYMSQAAAVNLILKQFFDGQDAMHSMGNISQLMQVLASQTGIDLSALPKMEGSEQETS